MWRMIPEQMTGHLEYRLLETTQLYGRDPATYAGKDAEAGGQEGQANKGAGNLSAAERAVAHNGD
jgi:hypothetical protein